MNIRNNDNCGRYCTNVLGVMQEYEQISPSVRSAILRKFDEAMCDKLENEVDNRLEMKADRLWSFRSFTSCY